MSSRKVVKAAIGLSYLNVRLGSSLDMNQVRGFASVIMRPTTSRIPGLVSRERKLWGQIIPAAAAAVAIQQKCHIGARGISLSALQPTDTFEKRHNSSIDCPADLDAMLKTTGFASLDELINATVPSDIRREPLKMGKYTQPLTESEFLAKFKEMMGKNKIMKSMIGQGYYGTHTPTVILRNIMENPGWYTQYTPYQAEIAQGRLESLLNFQTLVTDLTGMPLSNSSLLDEGTAAAEAMTMCSALARGKKPRFLVSDKCHPQTIEVCRTRADGLGLQLEVVPSGTPYNYSGNDVCGVLVQYPDTTGTVQDLSSIIKEAHKSKVLVCVASDLLALTVLKSPGEMGADIVVGSAQRFGVPMGFGGPHAAFLATSEEYKRLMPGRIIGVSIDSQGLPALRMAMQTREQHIRRDKATSNICTAQALLANMAAMYAIYHGPAGLQAIAHRARGLAGIVAAGASKLGLTVPPQGTFFDTVSISGPPGIAETLVEHALQKGINIRFISDTTVGVSVDETTKVKDVEDLLSSFAEALGKNFDLSIQELAKQVPENVPSTLSRSAPILTNPIFNSYHTEHEMLRYLARLEQKDLSLKHSMIALGSCTMKLNATTEMIPVTWPETGQLHPFAPLDQSKGYQKMFKDLSMQLCNITGFDAMSLQPNSGAAGEYTGLMAIRAYHQSNGDHHRDVCIIPASAHGTNPASAAMVGMRIIGIGSDADGNVNMAELKEAAETHSKNLAALMVTYPSTHGVYEDGIKEACKIIHKHGGQVYMDGANMNAQVGLTSPGHIGADVCHLNLHKTFCIPHGGGGPGMGPIGVKKHLAPFLPGHPVDGSCGGDKPFGVVSAAPFGSASILPISFAYISMMGATGLTNASKLAILNANYMRRRLEGYYPILFTGKNGTCAHEFILDLRDLKETSGVSAEDVAKRLMDYGYHAPTMSWPVAGTLMIEPTESESKAELDRFCDTMIAIREEIRSIEKGDTSQMDNVLKGAPHPANMVLSENWSKPYTREQAAFPKEWVKQSKFWPTVGRVDNVWGDRNLITKLQAQADSQTQTN